MYLFTYLPTELNILLPTYLASCLAIGNYPPTYLFTYLYKYLPIYIANYLYIYLVTYL